MFIIALAVVTVALVYWILHTPSSDKRSKKSDRPINRNAHKVAAPPAVQRRVEQSDIFRNVR